MTFLYSLMTQKEILSLRLYRKGKYDEHCNSREIM